MTDPLFELRERYGSARRPDRKAAHQRPDGIDDATVEALGKLSAALEVAEDARGHLYAFHRLSGSADLSLQEAVRALRDAGHERVAEVIDDVLVGRDVIDDRWTFQLVERYDAGYIEVFRAAEQAARAALHAGEPHVYEAEMKAREQTSGTE